MDLQAIGNRIEDPQQLSQLRSTLVQLVYQEVYHRQLQQNGQLEQALTKFPGSYPVCLAKRDFAFIRRNKYWVCEKSDGTRCMLFVLQNAVYVVDSRFNFYHANVFFPSNKDSQRPQHKTVLDGEMVFNHHYQKPVFMVFDVICVEGKRVGDLPLSKRLTVIREAVVTPLRNFYKTPEQEAELPFLVLGKEFVPLDKMDSLLGRVKHYQDEQGHRYIYQHGKRFNESDGLIFTPEEYGYKPGRSTVTKKWKWPALNTVDFFVQIVTEARPGKSPKRIAKLHLWGGMHQRYAEVRTVFFKAQALHRLMEDLNGAREGIIECAYDADDTGEWQYVRLRRDKIHADPLVAAFQQLENIAERITADYLRKHLMQVVQNGTPVDHSSTASDQTPTPVDNTPTPTERTSPADQSPLEYNDVIYSTPPDRSIPADRSHSAGGRKRSFASVELDTEDEPVALEEELLPAAKKRREM